MTKRPTIERLHELLFCEPSSGILTWRKLRRGCRQKIGERAGFVSNSDGYRYLLVDRCRMAEHQVVWAMAKGAWPQRQISHINGIDTDNAIENLRERTSEQGRGGLTVERLREILSYDSKSGEIRWLATVAKRHKVGSVAGRLIQGYRQIGIGKTSYPAGEIAWALTHGAWPTGPIKPRNGDYTDLCLKNLMQGRAFLAQSYKTRTKEGRAAYQKAFRATYPDVVKGRQLQRDFGITLVQWQEKMLAQNGKCSICEKPETAIRLGRPLSLAVDHDHATGLIRDLLCHRCNGLLGCAGDSVEILTRAIGYVKRHSAEANPSDNIIPLHKKDAS